MTLYPDIPGERLDAFLARSIENMSRSGAQKLLEEGCVLRNGKPGKKNDKLNMGDAVEYEIPAPKEVDIVAKDIPLEEAVNAVLYVLYEEGGLVREDLIREDVLPGTPTMLTYKTFADNGSMYNTPPTYCIYIAKLVYEWILETGGLTAMQERNRKKANLLYDYLDSQDYYIAPVEKESRSMMNVTFVTGNADLDKKFASEAAAAGMKNLKGHRSVGGMRASIYNAMPVEGVEKLVAFMAAFEEANA